MVDEALSPPAAADDVEVQVRNPRPQLGDGGERVLDLLVRHEPAEDCQPRMIRAGQLQRLGGRLVKSVAYHRDARGVDPEVGEVPRGRQ